MYVFLSKPLCHNEYITCNHTEFLEGEWGSCLVNTSISFFFLIKFYFLYVEWWFWNADNEAVSKLAHLKNLQFMFVPNYGRTCFGQLNQPHPFLGWTFSYHLSKMFELLMLILFGVTERLMRLSLLQYYWTAL